jgi:hypothetical protein
MSKDDKKVFSSTKNGATAFGKMTTSITALSIMTQKNQKNMTFSIVLC